MTPTDPKALADKIEAGAKFEGWYTIDTAADVAAVLEALRRPAIRAPVSSHHQSASAQSAAHNSGSPGSDASGDAEAGTFSQNQSKGE
jgi:hypothetical protein